ncbi:hypothetical protein ABD72_22515 [Brevibacillus laterosporus]|nr:hypothetical protein BrL25_00790 [Brevibacillus laterosporus DSM 25]MBG9804844.1 hypothetical protein [Brevibacillus laterosporus]
MGLGAKNNMGLLAAVESTQSGTMIFTVLGEVILLNGSFPRGLSLLGMIVVIIGMILTSLANGKQKKLVKLRREKKLFE